MIIQRPDSKGKDRFFVVGHSARIGLFSLCCYSLKDPGSITDLPGYIDHRLEVTAGVPMDGLLQSDMPDLFEMNESGKIDGGGFPWEFLYKAVFGKAEYDFETFEPFRPEVASFIDRHLPEIGRKALTGLDHLHQYELRRGLRFLTSGDTEARAQALMSFPLLSSGMIAGGNRDLVMAIDRREELLPVVADAYRLLPEQARAFSRLNQLLAGELYAEKRISSIHTLEEEFCRHKVVKGKTRPADPTKQMLEAALTLSRNGSLLGLSAARGALPTSVVSPAPPKSSTIPRTGMKHLMPDRQPGDPVDQVLRRMATIWSLSFASERASVSIDVFGSRMRRLETEDLQYEVKSLNTGLLRHVADFTGFLRRSVENTLLSSAIRQAAGPALYDLHEIGNSILNGKPISEEESLRMRDFMTALKGHAARLSESVVEPVAIHATGLMTYKQLKEASALWHRQATNIESRLMAETSDLSWKPLLGTVEIGGLNAREMVSTADFVQQGELEGHCVASYARKVMDSARERKDLTIVMSIEEQGGEILSTAEFTGRPVRGKDRWSWDCEQNMAAHNEDPCDIAEDAANAVISLLDRIPAAQVNKYMDYHLLGDGQIRNEFAKMLSEFGANLTDPDLPEKILASIRPYLPESLSGRCVEDWEAALAGPGFDRLRDEIRSRHFEVQIQPAPVP